MEPEKKYEQRRGMVAVISADHMGEGDPVTGSDCLLKGLSLCADPAGQVSGDLLFYNGGAFMTTEGSESLEDLHFLEEAVWRS